MDLFDIIIDGISGLFGGGAVTFGKVNPDDLEQYFEADWDIEQGARAEKKGAGSSARGGARDLGLQEREAVGARQGRPAPEARAEPGLPRRRARARQHAKGDRAGGRQARREPRKTTRCCAGRPHVGGRVARAWVPRDPGSVPLFQSIPILRGADEIDRFLRRFALKRRQGPDAYLSM